jgi:hypothetical protein
MALYPNWKRTPVESRCGAGSTPVGATQLAPLAQLEEAPCSERGCSEFDSRREYQRKEVAMDKRLLECGHTAPVKHGAGATWCPVCNEMALVVEHPVNAGTRTAVAPLGR